jgi:hypothetical protein
MKNAQESGANGDMPASPAYHEGVAVTPGLTKREMFAAMAMQGILAGDHPICRDAFAEDVVATASLEMADALLAALELKP